MPAITSPATLGAHPAADYTHGLNGVDVRLDHVMTNALWISVLSLCAVILIVRFGQILNAHLRHLFSLNPGTTNLTYWETDQTRIWPWLKKHLFAMNVGTLPSRLHALILMSYLTSNFVYCAYLDYNKPQPAVLAELRGRSGRLSMVNMVPLILLAGRNNPCIYLLRISFDTYNLFHRWIGRLCAAEAVIHTVAWAANSHAAKGHRATAEAIKSSSFLAYGLVSTVALTVIIIQASSIFRHAFYETFLHVHQALALVAIVGVWVHCDTGHLPGASYIHWALVLWLLDRAARITRILYRNVNKHGAITRVKVEALPGDGTLQACRLTCTLPRPWTFTPGTHAYIYLPTVSFWMNHPFSIAWSSTTNVPDMLPSRPTSPSASTLNSLALSVSSLSLSENENRKEDTFEKGFKNPLSSSASSIANPLPPRNPNRLTRITLQFSPEPQTEQQLHFLIAKRTGVTAKLFNLAARSPNSIITLPAFIEGPYGPPSSLASYGTILLFAAGIGITHQMGHIRHLLQTHAAGTSAVQKITLVWSVKNTECLEWVRPYMDEILAMPNRKAVLKVMLFVTRPRSKKEVVSRSERVVMSPGRCEPRFIVREVVRERIGAVHVSVCGPGIFGDEVRNAVREIISTERDGGARLGGAKGQQRPVVDFGEEAFTW